MDTIDKKMDSLDDKFPRECKIIMKWYIKEETLRETKEERLHSAGFNVPKIPGLKYSLSIAPNGLNSDKPDDVVVFLKLDCFKMVKKINADFNISIKSASKLINVITAYDEPVGWGKFLSTRENLFNAENKFFDDGIMTLELEATLKPEGLKTNEPLVNPSKLTQALWGKGDKDISLFVGTQNIMIHKWVLTLQSNVFEAMFRSGMKEAEENKVIITDFDADIVKIAIEFCYERNIKPFITDENAEELLKFADKYDMVDMKTIVESFLIENLSETNVCQHTNLSLNYNCIHLPEYCLSFLMKYFDPPTFLSGIHTLNDKILAEIARRLSHPVSETL